MQMIAKAIETTGIVEAQHRLLLDEPLPVAESSHVRVIVLVTEEADNASPSMRLATAIEKYQSGEISQEKAAELAQLNRRDFLEALAREKREVFRVDFDDLKEELARG